MYLLTHVQIYIRIHIRFSATAFEPSFLCSLALGLRSLSLCCRSWSLCPALTRVPRPTISLRTSVWYPSLFLRVQEYPKTGYVGFWNRNSGFWFTPRDWVLRTLGSELKQPETRPEHWLSRTYTASLAPAMWVDVRVSSVCGRIRQALHA